MKLLIVGSREITDFDISGYVPEGVELIISGGASGVDTIAEKYADKHRISKLILHPNYSKYGKGAPIVRNKQMVDIVDRAIIIWDGKSRGTAQTIEYAKKVGLDYVLINLNTIDKGR